MNLMLMLTKKKVELRYIFIMISTSVKTNFRGESYNSSNLEKKKKGRYVARTLSSSQDLI